MGVNRLSSKENKGSVGTIIALIAFSIFMTLAYNNCGQNRRSDDLAFKSLEAFQKDFAEVASDHYNGFYCDNLDSYSCVQKSFGPDLKNGQADIEFDCVEVAEGKEICARGNKFNFDSSSQIQDCKNCSDEEINKRYIFDEFVCYHKGVKLDGLYPIRADGNSLDETLKNTYKTCKKLLGSE